MAMRYIIRRSTPEDLGGLKKDLPQLDNQLEKPADGLRRTYTVSLSPMEKINYLLVTKKQGSSWVWTCPSIELVSENEAGLFALMKRFSLQAPAHLAHLENPKST